MADVQDMMSQMLESIVAARRANPPPTAGERQGALQEYQNAVRTAGVDNRAPWQVMMAGGAQAQRPLDANSIVPGMFKALEDWGNTQRESVAKREMLATKAMYDDVVARTKEAEGGAGMLTQLTHAALNPLMNIGGVGVNRVTGQTVVPKALEGVYTKVYADAFKAATEQKMPNPEAYAKQVADQTIQQHILSNPSIAGSLYAQRPGQTPMPSQGGPGAANAQTAPQPAGIPDVVEDIDASPMAEENKRDFRFDVSGLNQEDRNMVQRLIARYRSNPNPGTEAATMNAIQALMESGSLKQAPVAAPTLAYRDVPKSKMQESQAESVGKDLAKEGTMLNDAMSASNKMIMQLDLLDRLYSTPNMPEGELGPLLQQLRSGLKSLGVDVGKEVGAADMARSIASNFALHLRTGEGTNLLPGAMSNYEDKLLQQMAPVLSLTNEGRLALSQFMKEMAKTNARFGHEFNKMTDDRGIVSPEWRKRKERVMKEEMARIAEANREIMKRFQGAQ